MKEQTYENTSVHLIDLEKISPNPYQPRREFSEDKLMTLSNSIKQYGILQPIVVTKKEYSDGTEKKIRYELIAGERRFRASKLAGLKKIPAIIREGDHTDKEKFELAIIENIQREDLNPVDKAKAFDQLIKDFNLTHAQVAERMSKSREFVSNALRILKLPEYILDAVSIGDVSEGHTRPLLMLSERPDDQRRLFNKIIKELITVREAERYARNIATDKVRKKSKEKRPEIVALEKKLEKSLGTRVQIETNTSKGNSGKVTIEYFSKNDLDKILDVVSRKRNDIMTNEKPADGNSDLDIYFDSKDKKESAEERAEKSKDDDNTSLKEEKSTLETTNKDELGYEIDELDTSFDETSDDLYSVFDDEFLGDDNIFEEDLNVKDKEEKDGNEIKTPKYNASYEKKESEENVKPLISESGGSVDDEKTKNKEEINILKKNNSEKKDKIERADKSDYFNKNISKNDLEKDSDVKKINSTASIHNVKKEKNTSVNNDFSVKQKKDISVRKDYKRGSENQETKEVVKNKIINKDIENDDEKNRKTLSEALREIEVKIKELDAERERKRKENNEEKKKLIQSTDENNLLKNNTSESDKKVLNTNTKKDDSSDDKDDFFKKLLEKRRKEREEKEKAERINDNKSNDSSDDKDDFFKKLLEKRRKEREEKEKAENENVDNNPKKDFEYFKRKLEAEKKKREEEAEKEKPAWSDWEEEEVEATSGNPILAQLLKKAQEKSKDKNNK